MSYKALYRVFRPKTFGEVVGQEHIVSVLKSQVMSGQVSHAYLFTGTRGTGKTSIAKIFARAMSCPNSNDGEACMECPLCHDTLNDSSMDIVEIDAASNNGVDEIRELRENVKYAPVTGKYRVYIIDEVHMLSGGAFNALLKTLEEPPAHAVFILATTEPQKLPETIISRCQRFDFEKIEKSAIVGRLEFICTQVEATAEAEALELIADHARGGLRDAISLMDQCIVFGNGSVTAKGVLELLGKSDEQTLFDLSSELFTNDKSAMIQRINALVQAGQSPAVLGGDIIEHLHKLLVFKTAKNPETIVETTRKEEYLAQAKEADINQLLRAIKILSAAVNDMRYSFSPTVVLEVGLMEAATPEVGEDTLSILARLEALERVVEKGVTVTTASPEPAVQAPKVNVEDDVPWDVPPPEEDSFIMDVPAVKAPSQLEKTTPAPKPVVQTPTPKPVVQTPAPKPVVQESALQKVEEEKKLPVSNGPFGDREYDTLMKHMNKANKGVAISMKDSFFAGLENGIFTIGFPSDDYSVFAKAVEAKQDVILQSLAEMGFQDLRLCAKIVKQDKTEDLKEIFGDDIKFID